MGRFDFKSPGAAAGDAVTQYFEMLELRRRQQIADQRQATLDGAVIEDRMRARQAAEAAAKRQAELDRQAEADRLAKIHGPNADLSPEMVAALQRGGYRNGCCHD